MSAGPVEGGPRGGLPSAQGPACAHPVRGTLGVPAAHGGVAGASPEPGGSMSSSADWHARLGPLDFSVGVRHFELRGVFPEQPAALPAADGATPRAESSAGRADPRGGGEAPDREPEGGVTG